MIRIVLLSALVWGSSIMNWVLAQSEYRLPPAEVVDIIDARPEPAVSFSPDGKWMLLLGRDAMPSIEDLARRMLPLAGVRIDPAANGPFRTDYIRSIAIRHTEHEELFRLNLPDQARISNVSWSHTSRAFCFVTSTDEGSKLWGVELNPPIEPKLLADNVSTVLMGIDWMPDGESLLCGLVPAQRGPEPQPPKRPLGPNIQESIGNVSPTRTFQDLLSNPYDEQLFEYYGTSQLAIVGLDGSTLHVGQPALFFGATPSPDGRYLLVDWIKRPFSYLLTVGSFPHEIVVWSQRGEPVYQVADVPLAENIPIEGVRTGPRSVRWHANQPATLLWTEALDGGDPRTTVEFRDRVLALAAPFRDAPQRVVDIQHRLQSLAFFERPEWLATTEYDRDRRWTRTLVHDLDQPSAAPRVLFDRSIRDQYGDPGRPVTRVAPHGYSLIRQDANWIYLAGQGASPEGNLPFLDRRDLETGHTERVWQCDPGWLESLVMIVYSSAQEFPSIITRREANDVPPNYFFRNLENRCMEAITSFQDPTPQIRGIRKELVKYHRADGVPLSATLYVPADYREGTRLPLLIWAYPLEFNDPDTAGQVTGSPHQFTRITGISHLTLLTQGYAIMDNATMPIVGDPETMNDTFVEQIVGAAQAAIDFADARGIADRQRVAVGGHSYGAFMTANLLAHCDLFRAGVARSGAYNRTLTPFGFQSERRPFWEARDIYITISPFTHADKIKAPLLLIHGENDNNSGTFPIQSQRMYQAVKGNGGTVRLVMLPFESHGYRARESVLHTQAETIEWLNRYVRDVER